VSTREPLIRPPQQKRSQESLERVLQAGLEVLSDCGFEGFTLQEVSKRAGVSIGSIYARTPSKDALIMAIYERVMGEVDARGAAITQVAKREGLRPRELVEALVTELAELMLGSAATLRVFMRRAPVEPEILSRGAAHSQALAQVFEEALLEHRKEFGHREPALAVDIAYRIVYCTIARRITHGPQFESRREISDKVFVRELARAAADYLLGRE
jgi:AcrR family transcriptional regulator